MKRIILIVAIFLTGCQFTGWQPYTHFKTTTPSPTATQALEIAQTPTIETRCIVSASKALNLRDGAGIQYAVIDWLSNGEKLTMTGNQRGAWIQVTTIENKTGWINSNYCRGAK